MTYLITGVTGGLGKSILDALSKQVPASEIAVLVRSEEKGKPFAEAGYDVRIGDYSDEAVLEKAFAGVDTLMFVSGAPGQSVSREDQHRNVIAAAQKAGVKNVAYTSLTNAKESISILAPDHKATEELLEASGLNYKVLRNNWYLDNQIGNFQEAVANALVQDFAGQQVYELSGKLLTYADLYQAYKEATGQDVVEVSLSVADYQKALQEAGTPEAMVGFATAIAADIENGALDVESNDLETLLGHPQADTVEAIKELLG